MKERKPLPPIEALMGWGYPHTLAKAMHHPGRYAAGLAGGAVVKFKCAEHGREGWVHLLDVMHFSVPLGQQPPGEIQVRSDSIEWATELEPLSSK